MGIMDERFLMRLDLELMCEAVERQRHVGHMRSPLRIEVVFLYLKVIGGGK